MYVCIKLGLGRLPPSSNPASFPVVGGPLGGGWGPPSLGADAAASWLGWRWLMVAVLVLTVFFTFSRVFNTFLGGAWEQGGGEIYLEHFIYFLFHLELTPQLSNIFA